jgi:hypothetical protein
MSCSSICPPTKSCILTAIHSDSFKRIIVDSEVEGNTITMSGPAIASARPTARGDRRVAPFVAAFFRGGLAGPAHEAAHATHVHASSS